MREYRSSSDPPGSSSDPMRVEEDTEDPVGPEERVPTLEHLAAAAILEGVIAEDLLKLIKEQKLDDILEILCSSADGRARIVQALNSVEYDKCRDLFLGYELMEMDLNAEIPPRNERTGTQMTNVESGLEFEWDKLQKILSVKKSKRGDIYEDHDRKHQFQRRAQQKGFATGIFDVQVPPTLPYLKKLLELCENEGMSKEAQDCLALLCHKKWKL